MASSTTSELMPPKGTIYSDYPLKPIATPKLTTGRDDDFAKEGSFMALSHNAFIRGFNTIYQQAPRTTSPGDKTDFAAYCLAWKTCIDQHHHYEETDFFPGINKAAGKTGLMASAVEQHASFHDGLERFESYLLVKGSAWESQELIGILDSFGSTLREHLAQEPQQIADLIQHHSDDHPIDILHLALSAGKKGVTPGFLVNTLPVYFLNMEFRDV